MKWNIKSMIASMLSAMFLMTNFICVNSEGISSLYNADFFAKLNESAKRTVTYPVYIYNGNNISENFVEIAGESGSEYNFAIGEGMGANTNDVLEIKETAQIVELSSIPAKYIGILANGSTQSGNAVFTIIYEDGSEQECNVELKAMTEASAYSKDMGKALKKSSATMPKFVEYDSEKAYINLTELSTSKKRSVTSIKFNPAAFSYHVISISEIPYTQQELDSVFRETIDTYLSQFLSEKPNTLDTSDIEIITELLDALYEGGDEYSEEYEKIDKLYNAYLLYTEQNKTKTEYETLMSVKDYLTVSVTALEDSDMENLDKLLALYEKQDSSDEEELRELMLYYEMIDDIFIDTVEKSTIEKLKEDYFVYKEKKALEDEIGNFYAQYENKNSSDLTDDDIENIYKLIENYEKADEIGVEYILAEREFIEALIGNYLKFKASEDDFYYDLSSYFNKGFTANEGDTNVPDYWGTNDKVGSVTYKTGIRKSVWDKSHINGIVSAKNNINMQYEKFVITPTTANLPTTGDFKFKISTDTSVTDKNVVALKDNSIVVNGSGRMSKNFNFLSLVGTNSPGNRSFEFTINYADETSKVWTVVIPWTGYPGASVSGLSDNKKPYNSDGTIYNSSVTCLSRAYVLPVEKGKIIDNVVIKGTGAEGILLAITEEMISNEDYKDILFEQYNTVKGYTDGNFNKTEARIFSFYCEEGEKRGIDISSLKDVDGNPLYDMTIVNEICKKVLTADNKFEKLDKDTIVSTISFSQPVNEAELATNITVTKAGTSLEMSDYTLSMIDDKTAKIEIDDELFGGIEYKVAIANTLPLKDYPSDMISKAYEFTYTSPAYLEATLKGSNLTIKNNTLTNYSYVAVVTEISAANSIIYTNNEFSDTVLKSDKNTHNLQLAEYAGADLFVSIWDDKQKLLLNVTEAPEATTSATVENADYMYPALDISTNVLTISGFTTSKEKDKNITLEILKGGNSFMYKQALTNKDGYFEIVVPLNESLIPSGAMLSFTLGGDDFTNKVSLNNVYFAITQQKFDIIEDIADATTWTDVETVMKSEDVYTDNSLVLDPLVYKASGYDLTEASKLIFANKALFTTSDIPASIKNLRQLLVLSAFNQDLKDVVSKDEYLLHESLLGYSENIDAGGVTLYSLFVNAVSSVGRDKVISSVMNENYTSLEDLFSDLKENILINALEYPIKDGSGYVTDVLTNANVAATNLKISRYFTISDQSIINANISAYTVTSLLDIEKLVDDYFANSSGGGTSGGSTGGFSGSSTPPANFAADTAYLGAIGNNTSENTMSLFNDVALTHWAYDYIKDLYNKGIMTGTGANSFNPEKSLTRAELVKVICTAFNITSDSYDEPFGDVTSDSWYAPYVSVAYKNGIINGITEEIFAPDEMVTRQDLCVILYRVATNKSTGDKVFTDYPLISDYAKEAVSCLAGLGIVNGFEDGSFRPADGCTRAQCAKIVYMLLQQ